MIEGEVLKGNIGEGAKGWEGWGSKDWDGDEIKDGVRGGLGDGMGVVGGAASQAVRIRPSADARSGP